MMTKSQLIEAIQQINQTASGEWLERFESEALREYLDHLQLTQEPRGGQSRWVRRPQTPAAVSR